GAESVLLRLPRGPVPDVPLAPRARAALPERAHELLGALALRRRDGGLRRLADVQLRGGHHPRAPRPEVPRDDADDDLPGPAAARDRGEPELDALLVPAPARSPPPSERRAHLCALRRRARDGRRDDTAHRRRDRRLLLAPRRRRQRDDDAPPRERRHALRAP